MALPPQSSVLPESAVLPKSASPPQTASLPEQNASPPEQNASPPEQKAPIVSSASGVRLEPVEFDHTMLDGCWWPSSSDPAAELPVLVPVLDQAHGPVLRLLLSAAGWTTRPHGVTVAGRRVSIGYFAGQSPQRLTAICADGHLLVMHVDPAEPAGGVRHETDIWESEGGRLAPAKLKVS